MINHLYIEINNESNNKEKVNKSASIILLNRDSIYESDLDFINNNSKSYNIKDYKDSISLLNRSLEY